MFMKFFVQKPIVLLLKKMKKVKKKRKKSTQVRQCAKLLNNIGLYNGQCQLLKLKCWRLEQKQKSYPNTYRFRKIKRRAASKKMREKALAIVYGLCDL